MALLTTLQGREKKSYRRTVFFSEAIFTAIKIFETEQIQGPYGETA